MPAFDLGKLLRRSVVSSTNNVRDGPCRQHQNAERRIWRWFRPREDKRGFDLIGDALPFGRLWYADAEAAIGYAKFYSRSHAMIVRVLDESAALIETHESEGAFREF